MSDKLCCVVLYCVVLCCDMLCCVVLLLGRVKLHDSPCLNDNEVPRLNRALNEGVICCVVLCC